MTSEPEHRTSPSNSRAPRPFLRDLLARPAGGEVGYLELGTAIVIVPGGAAKAARRPARRGHDADWDRARQGFGDQDLANECPSSSSTIRCCPRSCTGVAPTRSRTPSSGA